MITSRVPSLSVCIASGVILLLLGACGRLIDEDLQVVAKIDDESITIGDVLREIRHIPFAERVVANKDREGRLGVLNRMIHERLLVREARLRNITVTDEEVEEALRVLQPGYQAEGAEGLDVEVTSHGGARTSEIKEKLALDKLLNMEITEDKMWQYYTSHKNDFQSDERVKAKLLIIRDEQIARNVFSRIAGGEDFSAVSRDYADSPAIVGGVDVPNYFDTKQLWPDVQAALSAMVIGQITLFQSPSDGHFRILLLVDRTTTLPFELAKPIIQSKLKDEFVEGLRRTARIEIFEKKLDYLGS